MSHAGKPVSKNKCSNILYIFIKPPFCFCYQFKSKAQRVYCFIKAWPVPAGIEGTVSALLFAAKITPEFAQIFEILFKPCHFETLLFQRLALSFIVQPTPKDTIAPHSLQIKVCALNNISFIEMSPLPQNGHVLTIIGFSTVVIFDLLK